MSTALDALLAARIHESGQALRRTTLRHTHLADAPLGIVVWRLGGERFRAAAVAWGPVGEPFQLAVAGEPRNRDLYFAALAPFATDLSARVRKIAEERATRTRGTHVDRIPTQALQLVVPNRTTVAALGLLGRYLAYLTDRGGIAPNPALVEAGKHLRFYASHARVPGQALVVPLDRFLTEHWATLLSPFEQANLAALDAHIEPPQGMHAFRGSMAAEAILSIGPEPTEKIDGRTDALLSEFNAARDGSTDPTVVGPLLGPLRDHYRGLVRPVWDLMARVVERERRLQPASSVQRRFEADREEFGRHADWVARGGRYRTKDTSKQAAIMLRRLEKALERYEAEKAVEDPACMVPRLLDGEAIRGVVTKIDTGHREVERVKAVLRPLLTLDTDDPVVLPVGKEVWWTKTADGDPWEIRELQPHEAGTRVVLKLCTTPKPSRLPAVGDRVTFSILSTGTRFWPAPLRQIPWTHQPETPPAPPEPIDEGDDQAPTTALDGATLTDPEVYA